MLKSDNRLYEFGPFRLDSARRLLFRDEEPLPLRSKAFDTLLALVRSNGRVIDKDELMKEVWADTIVEESGLTRNISELRKTLGESPGERRYIVTVPGRGYRFVASVREVEDEGGVLIEGIHSASRIVAEVDTVDGAKDGLNRPPSDPHIPDTEAGLTSSARQFEITTERRKRGAVLALAALVVVAPLAVGMYRAISRSNSRGPELKIINSTAFIGSELAPSFSPDGSQIAFVWDGENEDNQDVYVKLTDMGAPLRLTTTPVSEGSPVWSPDGRYIAYLRELRSEVARELYLAPALGGAERQLAQLSDDRHTIGFPNLSWSPDGRFLAVNHRDSPDEPTGIFLLDVNTSRKQRLTTAAAQSVGDNNPVFSPSGRAVAFVRWDTHGASDIYLAPIAGGEPKRLTFDKRSIKGLAWTPDGNEIIFASERGGLSSLWRVAASGGEPKPVERVGPNAFYPVISSRGNRLAYTQSTDDSNVWRIDLTRPVIQHQAPVRLIASTLNDNSPQYSPDGKRIVFASTRSTGYEIWVCDSDGGGPTQLTTTGGALTGTPRWSPDGRYIAYDSRPQGDADIYIVGAGGGSPRRFTTEPSEDVLPSWSRDGRWVYFCSNRSGSREIWKAPVEGGPVMQVTKNGAFEGFESVDGKFLYFTKRSWDAELWRVPVTGGEEVSVFGPGKFISRRNWALTDRGVYFAVSETPARQVIEFFSFDTRKVTPVFTPEKQLVGATPGLSVSPDGRWLLYTQVDQRGSDIMLVENFR
jgi:Tol biopolymer transport system component/DNA-binding winged helix-turn-helix (wHTH) protein